MRTFVLQTYTHTLTHCMLTRMQQNNSKLLCIVNRVIRWLFITATTMIHCNIIVYTRITSLTFFRLGSLSRSLLIADRQINAQKKVCSYVRLRSRSRCRSLGHLTRARVRVYARTHIHKQIHTHSRKHSQIPTYTYTQAEHTKNTKLPPPKRVALLRSLSVLSSQLLQIFSVMSAILLYNSLRDSVALPKCRIPLMSRTHTLHLCSLYTQCTMVRHDTYGHRHNQWRRVCRCTSRTQKCYF